MGVTSADSTVHFLPVVSVNARIATTDMWRQRKVAEKLIFYSCSGNVFQIKKRCVHVVICIVSREISNWMIFFCYVEWVLFYDCSIYKLCCNATVKMMCVSFTKEHALLFSRLKLSILSYNVLNKGNLRIQQSIDMVVYSS